MYPNGTNLYGNGDVSIMLTTAYVEHMGVNMFGFTPRHTNSTYSNPSQNSWHTCMPRNTLKPP